MIRRPANSIKMMERNQQMYGHRPGAGTHNKPWPQSNCQSTSRQGKKPYEVRPNWAIAYRTAPNSWTGVVKLSQTGERCWLFVSHFQDKPTDFGHYCLGVTPKGTPHPKPYNVQLLPVANSKRFLGALILGDAIKYRIWLGAFDQDGARYLRLRFQKIQRKAESR